MAHAAKMKAEGASERQIDGMLDCLVADDAMTDCIRARYWRDLAAGALVGKMIDEGANVSECPTGKALMKRLLTALEDAPYGLGDGGQQ
jgi:hypothetical protein